MSATLPVMMIIGDNYLPERDAQDVPQLQTYSRFLQSYATTPEPELAKIMFIPGPGLDVREVAAVLALSSERSRELLDSLNNSVFITPLNNQINLPWWHIT